MDGSPDASDVQRSARVSCRHLSGITRTGPRGDTVSYSIEGGNEAGLFHIDAASGELFYTGTGEDYESDATRYELTVRVPFSGLDFKAPSREHPRQIQATR